MADDVEIAAAITSRNLERSIRAARQPIPAGAPGECSTCGGDSPRLVVGRCAPCRDEMQRRASRGLGGGWN